MNLKDVFELYENVKEDMKFYNGSEVRTRILISLSGGSKNLKDIRKELHLPSATILHAMIQLEKKGLIFRETGNYSLSQIGEIVTNKLVDMMKAINSLKMCESLFLNHEIGCIPPSLIKDVGCLNNAKIIKSTPTDVFKPYTTFSNLLSKAKNVKHLSSVYYPQNTELFVNVLEKNGKAKCVLTKEVLNKLIESNDIERLKKSASSGNLELWSVDNNMKIFLTIGDDFVAMGLFLTEGGYDLNLFMISEGEESISWGNRLFNHYLVNAQEVELTNKLKNN